MLDDWIAVFGAVEFFCVGWRGDFVFGDKGFFCVYAPAEGQGWEGYVACADAVDGGGADALVLIVRFMSDLYFAH